MALFNRPPQQADDRLAHHAEIIVSTGASFAAQGRRRLEQEMRIE